MKQIETYTDIAAPLEDVWRVFYDIDRYKEWNPFLIAMKGELKEGAQITVTARLIASYKAIGAIFIINRACFGRNGFNSWYTINNSMHSG